MTETTIDQAAGMSAPAAGVAEEEIVGQLVERARAEGLSLTGPEGLLGGLTKMVLETALDAEMTEHLG